MTIKSGLPDYVITKDDLSIINKLAKIADQYDDNNLDSEARKFWGHNCQHENQTPHDKIDLYTSRGGASLLTLDDCMKARELRKKLSQPGNYLIVLHDEFKNLHEKCMVYRDQYDAANAELLTMYKSHVPISPDGEHVFIGGQTLQIDYNGGLEQIDDCLYSIEEAINDVASDASEDEMHIITAIREKVWKIVDKMRRYL